MQKRDFLGFTLFFIFVMQLVKFLVISFSETTFRSHINNQKNMTFVPEKIVNLKSVKPFYFILSPEIH